MTGTSSRYLDVPALAAYIGRTTKAVYRLVERGDIPTIRRGRKLQFDRERIDRWMERGARRVTG